MLIHTYPDKEFPLLMDLTLTQHEMALQGEYDFGQNHLFLEEDRFPIDWSAPEQVGLTLVSFSPETAEEEINEQAIFEIFDKNGHLVPATIAQILFFGSRDAYRDQVGAQRIIAFGSVYEREYHPGWPNKSPDRFVLSLQKRNNEVGLSPLHTRNTIWTRNDLFLAEQIIQ